LPCTPARRKREKKEEKGKEKEGGEIARDRAGIMHPRSYVWKVEVIVLHRAEGWQSRFYWYESEALDRGNPTHYPDPPESDSYASYKPRKIGLWVKFVK
jgi:hypothetical protein